MIETDEQFASKAEYDRKRIRDAETALLEVLPQDSLHVLIPWLSAIELYVSDYEAEFHADPIIEQSRRCRGVIETFEYLKIAGTKKTIKGFSTPWRSLTTQQQ